MLYLPARSTRKEPEYVRKTMPADLKEAQEEEKKS